MAHFLSRSPISLPDFQESSGCFFSQSASFFPTLRRTPFLVWGCPVKSFARARAASRSAAQSARTGFTRSNASRPSARIQLRPPALPPPTHAAPGESDSRRPVLCSCPEGRLSLSRTICESANPKSAAAESQAPELLLTLLRTTSAGLRLASHRRNAPLISLRETSISAISAAFRLSISTMHRPF